MEPIRCGTCKQMLSCSNFYKNKSVTIGYTTMCKSCYREKRYRRKNIICECGKEINQQHYKRHCESNYHNLKLLLDTFDKINSKGLNNSNL